MAAPAGDPFRQPAEAEDAGVVAREVEQIEAARGEPVLGDFLERTEDHDDHAAEQPSSSEPAHGAQAEREIEQARRCADEDEVPDFVAARIDADEFVNRAQQAVVGEVDDEQAQQPPCGGDLQ